MFPLFLNCYVGGSSAQPLGYGYSSGNQRMFATYLAYAQMLTKTGTVATASRIDNTKIRGTASDKASFNIRLAAFPIRLQIHRLDRQRAIIARPHAAARNITHDANQSTWPSTDSFACPELLQSPTPNGTPRNLGIIINSTTARFHVLPDFR